MRVKLLKTGVIYEVVPGGISDNYYICKSVDERNNKVFGNPVIIEKKDSEEVFPRTNVTGECKVGQAIDLQETKRNSILHGQNIQTDIFHPAQANNYFIEIEKIKNLFAIDPESYAFMIFKRI